ncbi:MAG: acetyl-CoA carboxylase biotin carboxyl carrier protein [Acidobacteriota bacterium]|jgi:acetyl-CoA carboxylase biotin carboxyl carrier protein
MFTFDELCTLIRVVSETGVGGLEVEREGARVRIEGVPLAVAAPQAFATAPLLPPQMASVASQLAAVSSVPGGGAVAASAEAGEDGLAFVTSPIVGTFYRAPNPDAEPYVKVGDPVHKGQVLCIVEAMKLMNEIESDTSGTIVKIYPENAQPVEFGERLFAIRPS